MSSRLEALKQMLKEDPADAFLNYALALELEKKGETGKAIELAEKIVLQKPSYLPVYYILASWQRRAGDILSAKTNLEKGIIVARQQKDLKTASEIQSLLDEITE